jgi:hypothetical protein
MKPNKGNFLGAIHLLNMIKSITYTAKTIAGGDAATTMAAGYASTILKCRVGVGRQMKGVGYLQVSSARIEPVSRRGREEKRLVKTTEQDYCGSAPISAFH